MPAASKWEHSPEIAKMAKPVIDEYHPHLVNARIAYIIQDGMQGSSKRPKAGTMAKPAGKATFLHDFDFIMTISRDFWDSKSTGHKEKVALIDHELCHADGEEKEDGEWKWSIRHHDVEEFAEIVQRRKLWHEELVRFQGLPVVELKRMIEDGPKSEQLRTTWLEDVLSSAKDALGVEEPRHQKAVKAVQTTTKQAAVKAA